MTGWVLVQLRSLYVLRLIPVTTLDTKDPDFPINLLLSHFALEKRLGYGHTKLIVAYRWSAVYSTEP